MTGVAQNPGDVAAGEVPSEASSLDLIVFGPGRSRNVFEETLERLAYALKSGIYPAGSKLPSERDLSARLEVSRSTIRDVIGALERGGYLTIRRGRTGGAFVLERPFEASKDEARRIAEEMGDDLPAILDYRWAIEPAAAALAARRADADGVRRLEEMVIECAASSDRAYRAADVRLHGQIALLAGSPVIAAAVTEIQQQLSSLFAATPVIEEVLRHSDDQHAAVVAAIRDHDEDKARSIMEEHMEGTKAFLSAFLT
jgi:DNA-binding FadR family transcriptional regulator